VDRGFGGVERLGRRRLAAGAREARLTRYRATCRVGGCSRPVEAYLAVRPGDDYLLSGGAYVRSEAAESRREELLGLIRAVGEAADGGDETGTGTGTGDAQGTETPDADG